MQSQDGHPLALSDRCRPAWPFVAVAGACLLAGLASAAAAGRSVWDGVYSAAQAKRGSATYAERCSACHGDFLDGDGTLRRTVALAGAVFGENWESASLSDLFAKIARTMPQDAPGSLTSDETLDLVAYLLQYNGYPGGTADLRESPELALIDIVGKEGPRPLRQGSLVRAVGCLVAVGADWTLTRATAPVRTRSPGASAGWDLARARAAEPGSAAIGLTNVRPGPDVQAGARVEAKGLWTTGGQDRIAVMSLQAVGGRCGE